ncbi:MAG: hypothetical protein ACYC3G_04200 [Minisyncoccota bacterium]
MECFDVTHHRRPHTLFFLAPPYWQIPGYRHDFEEQDFHDLANTLSDIQGRFLMTINDTPEVRDIFWHFKIEEVQLRYSMSRNGKARGKEHTELLVANY